MKKRILIRVALSLVIGILGFQQLGSAAEKAETPMPQTEQRISAIRDRLKEIAEKLGLSDEQKERIKPILRSEMEKMRQLRRDDALSRTEKLKKFQSLHEEITPKLKSILTAEQFEKWQKLVKERKARWQKE